jgi:LysM repeat protein
MLGLLGGSVLALWLVIQPPSVPGESSPAVQSEPTATPALTPQGAASPGAQTPTPIRTATEPAADGTPAATDAPPPTDAPTPAPTPVPETPPPAAGPIEYVVQEGDTWNGIAAAYGLDATELASFNGYVLDDVLSIGTVILIPQ